MSRSISTYACRPWSCRSLATSASCGSCAQPLDQPRHPVAELVRVGALERELVLRAADAVLDRQVLHRLHVERDALARRASLRLQPPDDLASRRASRSRERLQVDQHAAAVERRVGAVDADERRQALDRRVLAARRRASACWRSAIAAKEIDLRRFGDALDHAGVLHREEALGHDDVEQHRQHQRARPRPAASRPGGRAPSRASAP